MMRMILISRGKYNPPNGRIRRLIQSIEVSPKSASFTRNGATASHKHLIHPSACIVLTNESHDIIGTVENRTTNRYPLKIYFHATPPTLWPYFAGSIAQPLTMYIFLSLRFSLAKQPRIYSQSHIPAPQEEYAVSITPFTFHLQHLVLRAIL